MNRSYKIVCLLTASFGLTLTGCAGLDRDRPAFRQSESQPITLVAAPLNPAEFKSDIAPVSFAEDAQSGTATTIIDPIVIDAHDAESLTLAALEQIALASNPAISASLGNIEKSRGLLQQVGTPANPTFGYFGQQLADEGTAQNGFYIDQEIIRGNKLALNQQVLRHTTQAQNWELEAQRFRVRTDVRVAFYAAIVAQKELDAIR